MILVTGGAGFIGSALVWKLNTQGITDIVIVDHLTTSEKWRNLVPLQYSDYINRDAFLPLNDPNFATNCEAVVHLGACSATTETDMDFLMQNNTYFSMALCEWAVKKEIPFIYASSAATYGNGELGFDDNHDHLLSLRPLNRYGYSKQLFDTMLLKRGWLNKVTGLKFFNVFGPNEYHKGSMKSVFCKAYTALQTNPTMELFKSYHSKYADGGQMRDFVYIKDVVNRIDWLLKNPQVKGIYNVGSGKANTWNELADSLFNAMGLTPNIRYIDMPESIRHQYQYFTEAPMSKLQQAGCNLPMFTLQEAANDYVKYLKNNAVLDPAVAVEPLKS